MTTLPISPETAQWLSEKAREQGFESEDQFVVQLLEQVRLREQQNREAEEAALLEVADNPRPIEMTSEKWEAWKANLLSQVEATR